MTPTPGAPPTASDTRFLLLGDQPYISSQDPLAFDSIAANLAELVLSSRSSTPFTLGIEAGWGRGKSTLMHKLDQKLTEHASVTTVWFNAWTSDRGSALEGLIKAVLDRLDRNVLRRAARNQRVMSWLRIAASIVSGWLHVGTLVNSIWDAIDVDPNARNNMRALMAQAMADWTHQDGSLAPLRLLVVFVDDLDRCSPESVVEIFEAIKLYLDATGFVFVIGYDREVISDAVLSLKQYGDSDTSHRYLEKIVQISYRIPDVSDEQVDRLMGLYLGSSGTGDLFDDVALRLVIEQNSRNPRRLKRFINGFILEYGLDADWAQLGPDTLVRVLILDLYFSNFSILMRSRSSRDPVEDFMLYQRVRTDLRNRTGRDDGDAWQRIEGFLNDHGLQVPREGAASYEDLLRSIDQDVPVYAELARDDQFRSLIEGLGDSAARARLRDKLRRYSPVVPGTVRPSMGFRIYLSYRRDDAAADADRLYRVLTARFSRGSVMTDIDSIEVGVDFADTVMTQIAAADVVIVMIGREWLNARDADGRRRIEDQQDFVRLEIMTALSSDKLVIPVLLDGTPMPRAADLPVELQGLVRRNALSLERATWDRGVEVLVETLERITTPKSGRTPS